MRINNREKRWEKCRGRETNWCSGCRVVRTARWLPEFLVWLLLRSGRFMLRLRRLVLREFIKGVPRCRHALERWAACLFRRRLLGCTANLHSIHRKHWLRIKEPITVAGGDKRFGVTFVLLFLLLLLDTSIRILLVRIFFTTNSSVIISITTFLSGIRHDVTRWQFGIFVSFNFFRRIWLVLRWFIKCSIDTTFPFTITKNKTRD